MAHHAITLDGSTAARVGEGRRDLPINDVAGAERCEMGQPVRLLSPSGESLAIAVADPENALVRVMALAAEGHAALDARFWKARVERARALRAAFDLGRERGAHRLINGAADGLPGLAVDIYGDYAVLYVYSRGLASMGRSLAEVVRNELGLTGVVLKLRSRESAQGPIQQEIVGAAPPESLVVHEDGIAFEVHLLSGLNVGLFTDMREHRAALGRFARGRTVLNTFSYTGALSVAAARGGARRVTSVDLAGGVHAWARANFELNALDATAHRFETSEVTAFLKKAARASETFDVIIVDPPTYSAARAGAWSMRKDYPELIVRATVLLASGGLLWLSANSRELAALSEIARGAFARAKRTAQVLSIGGLPSDYPTLPAQPEDRYLQVCLFCVN
jgi:23S rRNA (cytosine1962-C5)-methyltransferase